MYPARFREGSGLAATNNYPTKTLGVHLFYRVIPSLDSLCLSSWPKRPGFVWRVHVTGPMKENLACKWDRKRFCCKHIYTVYIQYVYIQYIYSMYIYSIYIYIIYIHTLYCSSYKGAFVIGSP